MSSLDQDKTPLALPVQATGPGGSGFLPPAADPDRTPLALPAIGQAPVGDQGPRASHAKLTKRIGSYEVTAILGKGGMGTVFLARQEGLDRQVALKVLSTSISNDRVFIERFQFEARASAQLNHPNIVQGIDVGRDEATGFYFFAMEYVNGPSLKQVLADQQQLPERRALEIVRDMARALDCAARHGIVHRDIKPDNILLAPTGESKLTDLGLARSVYKDKGVTHSGETVGTPFYMAPEQIMGKADRIDIRTDIYSLGATLYHLVVGRPPYEGEAPAVIMTKHLKEKVPQAHKDSPAVSDSCSRLIAKMMAKDPLQRFQTPTELLEAVEKALERDLGSGERKYYARMAGSNPRLQALRRPAPSRRGKPGLTFLILIAGGGLLLISLALYLAISLNKSGDLDPARKTDGSHKTEPTDKSDTPKTDTQKSATSTKSEETAPAKSEERVLLHFDFNGELPPGFTAGTIDTRITCGGSRGSIKAVRAPENKYFYNYIDFDAKRTTTITITDKTYFSVHYYTTTQRNFKVQILAFDGTETTNIGLQLESVADNRWVTLRLRMVDAFRLGAGSGALIRPGMQINRIMFFSGRPESASDMYIDNFDITEAP